VSDTQGSGRRRFSRRAPSRRERPARSQDQESSLPQGIVTFCFTDIEGSTRLMHALGDRYADVCERHFDTMRPAWEAHRGKEVSFAGDSVLVAFADPTAAVVACATAQRLLGKQRWQESTEPRVRMGLHCGLAFPRDNNYLAVAVNQAARVMAAAHGGQVLVSEEIAGQADPPPDVSLLPVGRYRIRDFEEPVPLYQVAAPGLGESFPAVRALPADGHNLVTPATPIVGRDEQVARERDLLRAGRLVTLTGPGGVGKTRLANEIGRLRAADWPDGVWLVDLAPISDPALLGPAIAQATGAPNHGGDRLNELLRHLKDRSILVMLDNCEHLKGDVAELVDQLLSSCPRCGVLATSREPLGIGRERIERVPPLALPASGSVDPSEVSAAPAVQLLMDRSMAAGAHLAIGHDNAGHLAEICRRLDGLPLALEFAAAHLNTLRPAELLEGLNDRFRLLRSRAAGVPDRQRTMEGALEWSERLLSDLEQICLRRLSIFRTSFSVSAAAAATSSADLPEQEVPTIVWSLVDKSLMVADLTKTETRYALLESVREFAARRLDEHTETTSVAERLGSWYEEQFGPSAPRPTGWTGLVGADIDNLRGLIPILAPVDGEGAQRISFTIGKYLDAIESYQEGINELRKHLELLTQPSPTRVSLLAALAYLYLRGGQLDEAERVVAEAELLRSEVGSVPPWDDVAVERTRGDLAIRLGNSNKAAAAAKEAIGRPISLRGRARMSNQLGIASVALGDLDSALSAFEDEVDAYRQLGDEVYEASAQGNLAETALIRNDYAAAASHQKACCQLALQLGMPVMVAFSLIVAARIAAALGNWLSATELHAQAEVILERTGIVLYESDRRSSEEMLGSVRLHLGDDLYQSAQGTGRDMGLMAATELAYSVFAELVSE
jgi:predicted ATPase/class 3 adenylate cyclase/tetratricopeptide (TPR) repeat protein